MFGVFGSIADDGSIDRLRNDQLNNLQQEEFRMRATAFFAQQIAAEQGKEYNHDYTNGYLAGLEAARKSLERK